MIMPLVILKVNRYLNREDCDADSSDFEEIPTQMPEGGAVLDLLRSHAATSERFRSVVFDEMSQMIQMDTVIILNGRIVNPYDRSKTTLKEGDEVMVLSMLDGG